MRYLATASEEFEVREKRMSKRVFRVDLRQQQVSDSLPCIDATELFFHPDAPTVEECVHMLLEHDEVCLGVSEKRAIMQGAKVVGYIRIVDDREEAREPTT
jgi:hypothetical protein